jgi:DNA-binding PucR family transcriptional regulator
VEARRAALLDQFTAKRKQVALRLVQQMRTEIPEYAGLMGPGGSASPAFQREVLEHALEHVDAFIRCARSGEGPEGEELDFVRRRAETRARQLLPLDALTQAYLIGQRVWWETLVEQAGEDADDLRALADLTTSTFRYTHAITHAVAETYTQIRQGLSADRDRSRRDLLDSLLAAGEDLPLELVRRAEQLGLDAEGTHLVAVAVPSEQAPLRLLAETIAWHSGMEPASVFVVPRHEEVIALLAGEPADVRASLERGAAHLLRTHGVKMLAGIGARAHGLGGVRAGYREAQQALRHAAPGRPVIALTDVTLFDHLTATADPSSRHLVPEEVRRLVDEPALVETLRAYAAADLNVAEAARRLVVHANTVHYRLGRVQQLSGRDPRRFSDLVEMLAALRLLAAPARS